MLVGVGVLSAVANVVAALDGRAFTVSLGGMVLGLGAGVLAVGGLLISPDRVRGLVIATTVLLPTFFGYMAGGSLDMVLR